MEATKETKFGTKVAYGDEDDARTLNTCITQRKRTIPYSTMKSNHYNIIERCNNTHQRAPHTSKQTCACASDLGDASHVTCTVCAL